jgi:hypothetical protein
MHVFISSYSAQSVRDECIGTHGADAKECQELIEAHKRCLRAEGFDVGLLRSLQLLFVNFIFITCW